MATRAISKIKHEAHSRDANKARGEAESFIGIKAACQVRTLFYV